VAALIDRSTEAVGFPLRAVLRVRAQTWDPVDCPMCRRGDPVEAPGSRRLRPAGTSSGPGPGEAEPSS
jgi:orotate phosphoribosyltransferase